MSDEQPQVTLHTTEDVGLPTAEALGTMIGLAVEAIQAGRLGKVAIGQPPTPQLDRMLEIQPVSEQIGQFVAEFLADQGYILARWQTIREPCWRRRKVARSLFGDEGDETVEYTADPYACDCPPAEGFETPHTRQKLVTIARSDRWVNDQLARFFGLDPAELERERARLLDWVRQRQEGSNAHG